MAIINLENITKSFDGVHAVDKICVSFDKSNITALIGPNGAGKTTIFNLINGFIHSDSGSIIYKDINMTNLSSWQIATLGIGRLFQDVRVFNRMTVQDNVLTAFKNQRCEGVWPAIIERRKLYRDERVLKERVNNLLEFVGLKNKLDDLAENLSYGQQKLLALVRLLASDADVLLLDEPMAGVDPHMVTVLFDVIRNLGAHGKTVIIIEHDMNVIQEIADWVYFMYEGKVVSFGRPGDVLSDSEVRKAYIGL